jgi:signal transduction histidine kinase
MSLSKVSILSRPHWLIFGFLLGLIAVVYFLYVMNIMRWIDRPDFGWRPLYDSGPNVVAQVFNRGEDAGLRVGDKILEINGETFHTFEELFRIRKDGIGFYNTYKVMRGGRVFEVTIANERMGVKSVLYRSGFFFVNGLAYVLIGILVFLMKPGTPQSWIFLAMTSILGVRMSYFGPSDLMSPMWLYDLRLFIIFFSPAPIIHLALRFPKKHSFLTRMPWLVTVPYLISLGLFIAVKWSAPDPWNIPPSLNRINIIYTLVGAFTFLVSMAWNSLRDQSVLVRLQSKVIFLGMMLAIFIPVTELIIRSLWPEYHFPGPEMVFFISLILFPLSIGYSIVKHNLFDIDAIIKRTYGYVLTTGGIAGVYAVFVFLTNLAFGRFEFTKSPLFPLIFILGVVFFFNPIRNRVQKLIDRVFYRLEYNYQETVQRISDSLRSLLSFDEIGKRILNIASSTMFMESGCILVENGDRKSYKPMACVEKSDPLGRPVPSSLSATILTGDDPLVRKISERRREVTVYDIMEEPYFAEEKKVYLERFQRLEAALIMPLVYEDRLTGLIALGNKKSGKFYRREDINLLRVLANQGAVAIENARLHQARIEALEQSKKELERLNKAKSRALDHLSHELRTPLSVVQGNIRLLKRKTQSQTPPLVREEIYDSLEKNLNRLSEIQQETDQIIRSYEELEKRERPESLVQPSSASLETIELYPFAEHIIEQVRRETPHREIQIIQEGERDPAVRMDPLILEDVVKGLLKNGIENTPDEGMLRVIIERKNEWVELKVMDFGIGITKENQRHLWDGLFHTLDTELYTSGKPYDFGAGGKGLDLLRFKAYAQRYGFEISAGSERCRHLPTDRDLCPGRISNCPYCKKTEDCYHSGGSTFCLTFQVR